MKGLYLCFNTHRSQSDTKILPTVIHNMQNWSMTLENDQIFPVSSRLPTSKQEIIFIPTDELNKLLCKWLFLTIRK